MVGFVVKSLVIYSPLTLSQTHQWSVAEANFSLSLAASLTASPVQLGGKQFQGLPNYPNFPS